MNGMLGTAPPVDARFWPPRQRHTVKTVPLANPLDSGFDRRTAQAMRSVTVASDALRCLQNDVQSWHTEHDELRQRVVGALNDVAFGLSCPESIQAIRLRGQAMAGRPMRDISADLLALDEQQLVTVCGELGTWLGKSPKRFHSSLFCVVDRHSEREIRRVDSRLADTAEYLRSVVDRRLTLMDPPSMKVADLMYCGGEANLYPKHFAYFLPEDEGLKRAPVKKTLTLGNVYRDLYCHVTNPFAADKIGLAGGQRANNAVKSCLVRWFRGHDTGHGVRLPDTDYKVLRRCGWWTSMVLQETLADSFG